MQVICRECVFGYKLKNRFLYLKIQSFPKISRVKIHGGSKMSFFSENIQSVKLVSKNSIHSTNYFYRKSKNIGESIN